MNDAPTQQPVRKVTAPGASPAKPKKRRRIRRLFNLILFIGIIAAISLFAWAEQQRRDAISRLQQTEQELEKIRQSTERGGTEVAKEVLTEVRKHMDLPTDPEPTVATIIDVEALRQTSDFYNKAENGDHLVITQNRAILYDPDRKLILDVVPVRIDQTQQGEAGASPGPEGQGAPAGQAQPSPEQPAGEPTQPPGPSPAAATSPVPGQP